MQKYESIFENDLSIFILLRSSLKYKTKEKNFNLYFQVLCWDIQQFRTIWMSWNEIMSSGIIYKWLRTFTEKWISKHVHPTPKASDVFKATLDFGYSICCFVWQRLEVTAILRWKDTERFLLSLLITDEREPLLVKLHWVLQMWSWKKWQFRGRGRKLFSKQVKDRLHHRESDNRGVPENCFHYPC